jgi:hypothetical protein
MLSKSIRESCRRIFASFSYHVDTESVDDTFVGKLWPFSRTDKESVDDTLVGKLLPSLGSKMNNRLRPEPATPSSEASKSHVGREPEQLSSAVAWGVEPDQHLPEAVHLTDTEAIRVVQLLALQVMTRNAARRACTSQNGDIRLRQNPPNSEPSKPLYALIQSAQESDPLCRRVDKELRLRDLNQMQCPPRQRETVATRAHWSST